MTARQMWKWLCRPGRTSARERTWSWLVTARCASQHLEPLTRDIMYSTPGMMMLSRISAVLGRPPACPAPEPG